MIFSYFLFPSISGFQLGLALVQYQSSWPVDPKRPDVRFKAGALNDATSGLFDFSPGLQFPRSANNTDLVLY